MPESAAFGRPSVAVLVATVGGIGYVRPAPGTWASVAAGIVALGMVVSLPTEWLQAMR